MPLKKKIERCTKSAAAIREIVILTAQTGEAEFSETADRAKVNPACRRMYRHTSKDSSLAGHSVGRGQTSGARFATETSAVAKNTKPEGQLGPLLIPRRCRAEAIAEAWIWRDKRPARIGGCRRRYRPRCWDNLNLKNKTEFAELLYFFKFKIGTKVQAFALVILFSPPDFDLLKDSDYVVWSAVHMGVEGLQCLMSAAFKRLYRCHHTTIILKPTNRINDGLNILVYLFTSTNIHHPPMRIFQFRRSITKLNKFEDLAFQFGLQGDRHFFPVLTLVVGWFPLKCGIGGTVRAIIGVVHTCIAALTLLVNLRKVQNSIYYLD
ncbi:hypothetical protein B0H13DRAFT_1875354 [Mycena leptocephala]|nr:hypothetical protein B0H13DRAFT_1875354 [Mycena leptocephala]